MRRGAALLQPTVAAGTCAQPERQALFYKMHFLK